MAACGLPGGTSGQPNQDLAQQFLTERNGGTPVAVGNGGPNAPVAGFVQNVDGPRITIKRPIDGSTATIELADGAQIHKDADAQLSEIKAGDTLTAVGSRQGDVFLADLLRIGGDAQSGGPVIFDHFDGEGADGPAASSGKPDQVISYGPGSALPPPVTGTVTTIKDSRIVLKDKDGASTTVKLAANAKIQKAVQVGPAQLIAGVFIIASGTQNGDVFQATQVQILPAPTRF
jgi:hypothetical protein